MVMAVQAHLSLTLSAPRAERGSALMRFPNPDAAVIVIAQTVMRLGGTEHRHWHRGCAKRILEPGLSRVKAVNARESGRQKLESRGRRPAGKRGRRTPRR